MRELEKANNKKVQCTNPYLAKLNGFIGIRKPMQFTSNDVIQKVKWNIIDQIVTEQSEKKKILSNFKVGHGGTLDPNATGVLVLGFGDACKKFPEYLRGKKEYVSVGRLGANHDTDDIWGKVIKEKSFDHVTLKDLERALEKYKGTTMQIPPNYSAISINGQRMYRLAMKGKPMPDIPARSITISELELRSVNFPDFEIKALCSGGTYIRALIRDIGEDLGTCASMASLVRTIQCNFSLKDCIEIEDTKNIDFILNKLRRE